MDYQPLAWQGNRIRSKLTSWLLLGLVCALVLSGCLPSSPPPLSLVPPEELTLYEHIVVTARREVEKGVRYDASYRAIPFPMGDVPPDIGCCTDVVVRALRGAGFDLQELIYEDMKEDFSAYPQLWGHTGPDPNIDHRRIPNQMTFFERHGQQLPLGLTGEDLATWQPGDIVYWHAPGREQHCGIITEQTGRSGLPLVIHNGSITKEEDCLGRWPIIGHFRFPPQDESS